MKGKRADLSDADCAIARSLDVIGDWWSLLIIRDAFGGLKRFGEFQKNLNVAKNILSTRLKKLVEEEIFKIERDPQSPGRNCYVLTPKGEGLYVVLVALWQWGEDTCFSKGELRKSLVDSRQRVPLARVRVRSSDGREVGARGFQLAHKSARRA